MHCHNERRQLMRHYFKEHGVAHGETPPDHIIDAAAQFASETQQIFEARILIARLGLTSKIERCAHGAEVLVITQKN